MLSAFAAMNGQQTPGIDGTLRAPARRLKT